METAALAREERGIHNVSFPPFPDKPRMSAFDPLRTLGPNATVRSASAAEREMSKAWERTRFGLAGIGTGIMVAVLYLRYSTLTGEALDHLRDGAILLIGVSVVIGFFNARAESKLR